MSKQTFRQWTDENLAYINDENPDTRVRVKQGILDACRELWEEDDWYFSVKTQGFITAAPYVTGTLTLTNGLATVSIAGGSLLGLEGYRIVVGGVHNVPYTILTVTGGGTGAIVDKVYLGTTEASTNWKAYKEWYELPLEVDSLISVLLQKPGWRGLDPIALELIEDHLSLPRSISIPQNRYIASPVAGVSAEPEAIHIGLYPVPNAKYAVSYRYYRTLADMTADTDVTDLPEKFIPAAKALSKHYAYKVDGQDDMAAQSLAEYRERVDKLRRTTKTESVEVFHQLPVDRVRKANQVSDGSWLWRSLRQ